MAATVPTPVPEDPEEGVLDLDYRGGGDPGPVLPGTGTGVMSGPDAPTALGSGEGARCPGTQGREGGSKPRRAPGVTPLFFPYLTPFSSSSSGSRKTTGPQPRSGETSRPPSSTFGVPDRKNFDQNKIKNNIKVKKVFPRLRLRHGPETGTTQEEQRPETTDSRRLPHLPPLPYPGRSVDPDPHPRGERESRFDFGVGSRKAGLQEPIRREWYQRGQSDDWSRSDWSARDESRGSRVETRLGE